MTIYGLFGDSSDAKASWPIAGGWLPGLWAGKTCGSARNPWKGFNRKELRAAEPQSFFRS
jgi:hypothetical protein